MSQIILEDDLKTKLTGSSRTIEVQAADGRIVGQFVPQALYLKLMYAWAQTAVTDEELDRADLEPGEPLGDVFKLLRAV